MVSSPGRITVQSMDPPVGRRALTGPDGSGGRPHTLAGTRLSSSVTSSRDSRRSACSSR